MALGDPYFETITGLARSDSGPEVVTYFMQDRDDFVWIASTTGLYRFDGNKFKVFQQEIDNPNSLAGNHIHHVWQAQDGRLWIATNGNGLSVMDPLSFEIINYSNESEDPQYRIHHNTVRWFSGDAEGNVYIGTNGGLSYSANGEDEIRPVNDGLAGCNFHPERKNVFMTMWHEDKLWISHNNGICKISTDKTEHPNISFSGQAVMELGEMAFRFTFDSQNRLWAGTERNGIYISDSEGNKIRHLTNEQGNRNSLGNPSVLSFAQPTPDEMWLALYGGGINIVDTHSLTVKKQLLHQPENPHSLNLDLGVSLLSDRRGDLWFGSWGGGINWHHPANGAVRILSHSDKKKESLTHSNIKAFLQRSDGQIWVGSRGNGVDFIDPEEGVVGGIRPSDDPEFNLGNGNISELVEENEDSVWIGTVNGGLFNYQPSIKKITHFGSEQGLGTSKNLPILPA